MLEKLTAFLDSKFSEPMARLSEQRHLRAIRDGIVATLPLIIVGSFFLILGNPPLPQDWGISKFLIEHAATIVLPFRMTMSIMTLYAVFGIGTSLAKSYKLDGLSGGILSILAFLLTITPVNIAEEANAGAAGFVVPMGKLGAASMFVGIVVSIIAVEIFHLLDKSGFKIKMPAAVPESVARSFEALTPTLAIVVIIGGITYFVGFDWHAFITTIMTPLVSAVDSLPSVLLLIFLEGFFWCFGIHGTSIVGSIARPLWLVLLEANTAAVAAGNPATAIAAEPFFQWFVWIGGSGCTIGFAILLAFKAKSTYGKSLGRTTILPVLFNINEPIIFGSPIVLNLTLIIPFMLAPLTCAIVAWFATSLHLVNHVVAIAPWTLPGPIGAYLATGGDYRAALLNIVCILISLLIYYPFFRLYDKKMLDEENGVEQLDAQEQLSTEEC